MNLGMGTRGCNVVAKEIRKDGKDQGPMQASTEATPKMGNLKPPLEMPVLT